jgi:hypothetical protein
VLAIEPIELDRGADIRQRIVSFLGTEWNPKVMAQRTEFEVRRRSQRLMFVKQPHCSMKGAEDSIGRG